MKLNFLRDRLLTAAILFLLCNQAMQIDAAGADTQGGSVTPFAIPTFHCLGLYWSPEGGAADKEVAVR